MDPAFSNQLAREIGRRRTFAIISHPDAGKTTLTEKLLLYGGAIHLAGAVKAKANQRKTTSDWMEIERQRGISISTSVMCFEYEGRQVNLLDTPGHKDFSEDTYRTLVAADAAVMLIDAAKGVEPQTRKLFEVCRMRGLPIFTFFNKLDRPARDPLELLDELEQVLGIRSSPISWPIGQGPEFKGVFDRAAGRILLFQGGARANATGQISAVDVGDIRDPEAIVAVGGDPELLRRLHGDLLEQLELLEIAGDPLDHDRVLRGDLTPVFFGSAMNNFGVQHFLEKFLELAPPPGARMGRSGPVPPTREEFSGLFFKIQANMDPQHRDRVAFLRVCSGKFVRGMSALHARLGKEFRLNRPLLFFAQDRRVVEDAWPGDIVGLVDTTGDFRIGDTLCDRPVVEYEGVPRFSPESFAGVQLNDPLKRKQLKKALDQLSEEGVVQIFRAPGSGDLQPVLGVVGALQFEVFEHRVRAEYNVEVKLDRLSYVKARWMRAAAGADLATELKSFHLHSDTLQVEDRDGQPVLLFKTEWGLRWTQENYPKLEFLPTAPLPVR